MEETNEIEKKADRYNNNVKVIRVIKRQTVIGECSFAQWKSEEDGHVVYMGNTKIQHKKEERLKEVGLSWRNEGKRN